MEIALNIVSHFIQAAMCGALSSDVHVCLCVRVCVYLDRRLWYFCGTGKWNKEEVRTGKKSLRKIVEMLHHYFCVLIVLCET